MNILGCMNVGGIHTPKYKNMPATKKSRKKPLFKAKFLHLKSWKMIREPPDCTRNEPTLDIPIGGSGQDIKKRTKWQIHAICENMLIMKHVPQLGTDKKGKKT